MIIQTFMTSQMTIKRLIQNVIIAALSLAYAHKSGYKVKMYTDSIGYMFLKALPYDDINTELDSIKIKSSNSLWAVCKYYALMKEPIGTIHTDFDVMLKKHCLDGLLDNADIVCQIKEDIKKEQIYKEGRSYLLHNGFKDVIDVSDITLYAYNVGIIGYGSERARNAHAGTIMTIYNKLKDNEKRMPTLDFYIELAHLYNLEKNGYKINPIIKDLVFNQDSYKKICEHADSIGYCHLQSGVKYRDDYMNKIIGILKNEFRDIYDLISNFVDML